MRIQPTRDGLWLTLRQGSSNLYPWRAMLLPVLTPLLLVFFLVVLVARRSELPEVLDGWQDDPAGTISRGTDVFIDHIIVGLENLLATELAPETSQLPTLRLNLDKNAIGDMMTSLRSGNPALGHQEGGNKPYFPGEFLDETGRWQECNASLRGLSAWHHQPEKPSLRVRIKRGDIARGRRYIELQRPEDVLALRNWIPEELGRELGLVSGISDHVRLFVNDRYVGVYMRTMRAGEPLALENGRMPGTFFKGDAIGIKMGRNLWDRAEDWDTFGAEDDETQEEVVDPRAMATMQRLLDTVDEPPSVETLERLASSLDLEAYAKWAALMITTGSVHSDKAHNHMYFYSPNQGLLEPVPWDCNSFGTHVSPTAPIDVILNPIMAQATRDPRWVHRRNQVIYELMQGSASREALHRMIDRAVDRMLPDLKADDNLASLELVKSVWKLVPASVLEIEDHRGKFKSWVDGRARFLAAYFADARIHVEAEPEREGWSRVTVFGNVAVRAERRDGTPLVGPDGRPAETLLPGLSNELHPMLQRVSLPHAVPVPLVYTVHAEPGELRFSNSFTKAALTPAEQTPPAATPRSMHPWEFAVEPTETVILGPGEVFLERDLHVGRRQELIIRPGTVIKLGAGVGIYSRGRTTVEGRADAKVVLEPAGHLPWGAFAVAGAATAGSSFAHMQVSGGGEASDGQALYKGMFSVYNCPDLRIRYCWFGANATGDDAVNLAESHIDVQNCRFQDALSDALDIDMCRGRVVRCDFAASGNDGLDLMTSQVLVEDCTFEGCGDKGISVGERSRALVRNCQFTDCEIAIEAKDDSMVLIQNSVLRGNGTAFHAYQKKWIYNRGGRGCLMDCTVEDSRVAHASVEKRSRLDLLRTPIRVPRGLDNRMRKYDELPGPWLDLWETWR